ncbi:MAG: 23S rRNA (guanosine(2251)-2'-O)-methyltransferase RlmB [Gammaproteobacteria bacterium]|nr:23S rRNA (guanosine(2251)-2'-O)-methyltransferase RlmB [Gammaproteobacteria bacterium]
MSEAYVYGCHVVEAILGRAPERVLTVHFDAGRADTRVNGLRSRVAAMGLASEECRKNTLERFVGDAVHQGVVARVRPAKAVDEQALYRWLDIAPEPLVLVLDGIQDPRNLGACIRTADAAGAGMVVISRSESADLTGVARKAASGAAEWLPVARVGNLARVLKGMKERGVWLLGADEGAGTTCHQIGLTGPLGVVLGAEGAGLRRLTRETCDALVRIPMQGGVESLNVSVATGVILYEALRQRTVGHD